MSCTIYVVVWKPLSLRSITRGGSSASTALLLKYAATLIPCRALSALGKKLFAKRCNLHGRHEADALLTFTACTVVVCCAVVSCCTECSLFFDALCVVCTAHLVFAFIVLYYQAFLFAGSNHAKQTSDTITNRADATSLKSMWGASKPLC